MHDWLEPDAQAKGELEGPTRTVRWLGDVLLAVAGFDGRGGSPKGSGLKVIDTRAWSVRTMEEKAANFASTQGVLLAYCCNYAVRDTFGLTAYDPNGRRLWHIFPRTSIPLVAAAGGRVYVLIPTLKPGGQPPRVAVVDVRTGKVLRRVQTPWIQLLQP